MVWLVKQNIYKKCLNQRFKIYEILKKYTAFLATRIIFSSKNHKNLEKFLHF